MPFKYDANGAVVLADHNGKKLPVFVNAKGEEAPFDADATLEAIARINAEAKTHREAREAAESKLATYNGLDPLKAREALDVTSKLDAKKLIDAGEIDRVKADISKGFQAQLDEAKKAAEALEERLYDMTLGSAFANSKFIKEKCALPPDFVQARFAANFGIENDRVYAVDAVGNKIYSKSVPTELANVDEALEVLIGAHPQKDSILRGNGASGSGAAASSGVAGGKRTVARAVWETLPPEEQAKAGKDYALVD